MIVPSCPAAASNLLVSERICFTDALLHVKNLVYFDRMVQYGYHSNATIIYIEIFLEQFYHDKNVFSRFHASKSTPNVMEALKTW